MCCPLYVTGCPLYVTQGPYSYSFILVVVDESGESFGKCDHGEAVFGEDGNLPSEVDPSGGRPYWLLIGR